jgi:DnaA-homolog protein
MAEQIPLSLKLSDAAIFENFFPGENVTMLACLKNLKINASEFLIYLWGPEGSGRTHLLQASCQDYSTQSEMYIDLRDEELRPDCLNGLEYLHLICLDNIDSIFGKADWELAIFNLYNRAFSMNTRFVIAGLASPLQSHCQLPDLRSRLSSALIFSLKILDDQQKILALQQRAKNKGLYLSLEAAQFLLNRYPRNTHTLFSALETLDQASLVTKHKLTIPFIKQVLPIS